MDPSSRPQLLQDNMASSDHHQTLESMLVCTKLAANVEKKPIRLADQQALKCPRCDSANTKFCYYNNYSLTQPRYFCKSCRRYWTKGGTLRNVPVGGGCRRNKRSSSSSCSSSSNLSISSSKIIRSSQEQQHPNTITANNDPLHNNNNNVLLSYNNNKNVINDDSTDLSLAFTRLQNGQLGFNQHFSYVSNGFVETPLMNGFQNVYYGGDNLGNVENVGGMGGNVSGEMGSLPYEDLMMSSGGATTAVKEEGRNGRVLWGYPWQNVGDVDAVGRQSSWINGLGSANWHGLLNTPALM